MIYSQDKFSSQQILFEMLDKVHNAVKLPFYGTVILLGLVKSMTTIGYSPLLIIMIV